MKAVYKNKIAATLIVTTFSVFILFQVGEFNMLLVGASSKTDTNHFDKSTKDIISPQAFASDISLIKQGSQDMESHMPSLKDKDTALIDSDLNQLIYKPELPARVHSVNNEVPELRNDMLQQVREAAKNGEWKEFLYFVQDIYAENPRLILGSKYISQAIQYDAPVWVFETLLVYGEEFNYAHTLQLARSDKLSLSLKLLPLGLDLHAKSPQGENAVHAATSGFRGLKMLFLLVGQNVAADLVIGGMDPLEYSLSKITKTSKAYEFIEVLVTEGNVKLTPRHRKIILELQMTDPEKYQRLIDEVPDIEFALRQND